MATQERSVETSASPAGVWKIWSETTVIPLSRFYFDCQVASMPDGKTRVSQAVTVGGPLGGLVGGMMGKQIADTFPALLQGLAKKAESTESRR